MRCLGSQRTQTVIPLNFGIARPADLSGHFLGEEHEQAKNANYIAAKLGNIHPKFSEGQFMDDFGKHMRELVQMVRGHLG